MLLDEFARDLLNDFRVGDLGGLGDERHAVTFGEHFEHLLFADEIQLGENFAQQLAVPLLPLQLQRFF